MEFRLSSCLHKTAFQSASLNKSPAFQCHRTRITSGFSASRETQLDLRRTSVAWRHAVRRSPNRWRFPRWALINWLCRVSFGLKIHAERSSNGSSRPASHKFPTMRVHQIPRRSKRQVEDSGAQKNGRGHRASVARTATQRSSGRCVRVRRTSHVSPGQECKGSQSQGSSRARTRLLSWLVSGKKKHDRSRAAVRTASAGPRLCSPCRSATDRLRESVHLCVFSWDFCFGVSFGSWLAFRVPRCVCVCGVLCWCGSLCGSCCASALLVLVLLLLLALVLALALLWPCAGRFPVWLVVLSFWFSAHLARHTGGV